MSKKFVLDFITVFFLNTVIVSVLFYLFNILGWIIFTTDTLFLYVVLSVIVVSLITKIVVYTVARIASPAPLLLSVMIVGLIIPILDALMTYFFLKLAGMWTGMFIMTNTWWQVLIIGFSFLLFNFNQKRAHFYNKEL